MSNRDEFLSRPTSTARFWDPPHNYILAPFDLQREEHGTWIGVTRSGKVCVLLNVHEKVCQIKQISRGLFTKEFLESPDGVKEWIAKANIKYGQDLEKAGGFYMFVADLGSNGDPSMIFSNREPTKIFHTPTLSLSNSESELDQWPKTHLGDKVFNDIIKRAEDNNWSEDRLVESLFKGLSTDTFPKDQPLDIEMVRHSIYIPPFEVSSAGDLYGTRTQTVYLVDRHGNARYVERILQDSLTSEFRYNINMQK